MKAKKGSATPKKTLIPARKSAGLHPPTKTFQQEGKWIEKPNKTAVLICPCGNRYLKTRPGQERCLRCLSALSLH